jgi:hypothetical protein
VPAFPQIAEILIFTKPAVISAKLRKILLFMLLFMLQISDFGINLWRLTPDD